MLYPLLMSLSATERQMIKANKELGKPETIFRVNNTEYIILSFDSESMHTVLITSSGYFSIFLASLYSQFQSTASQEHFKVIPLLH